MLARIRGHIDAEASVDPGAADELLRALARRRHRLRRALIEAMDDPRYVELIERLVAAAADPRMRDKADARGRVPVLALLVPPAGRVREAVERLGNHPSDKRLHRVRINAKRLRYAAEAVAPVAAQPVSRVAKAAARVQDVLGEHQDAVVAATWLRTRESHSGKGTALPARLERAEREAAAAARAAWPAAWGKLERAMNAAGL
jgi:CHAD domain-containing protein